MAFNKVAVGVLIVFLASASANAVIINCLRNGTGFNNTEICLECNFGFTVGNPNTGCSVCPGNCATCNLNGTCFSCLNGQSVVGGVCVGCGSNCASCSATGCQRCNGGFFLRNGSCLSCPRYCNQCSSETRCENCIDDYETFRASDRDEFFYCRLKDDRRSAWWTWLVAAAIIALLAFAICCYALSARENTNPFYAPLTTTAPAYQMTTQTVQTTTPAYGVQVPAQASIITPGQSGVQYVPMGAQAGKTGYFGGY